MKIISLRGAIVGAVSVVVASTLSINLVSAHPDTVEKQSTYGEVKPLGEFGEVGSPERMSGMERRVVIVYRTGHRASGPEPECGTLYANCKQPCFTVPNKPISYYANLDGRWEATHTRMNEWFNTDFGSTWARLRESSWNVLRNGWYKVCFSAKNWKHDWDRSFLIEVRY